MFRSSEPFNTEHRLRKDSIVRQLRQKSFSFVESDVLQCLVSGTESSSAKKKRKKKEKKEKKKKKKKEKERKKKEKQMKKNNVYLRELKSRNSILNFIHIDEKTWYR